MHLYAISLLGREGRSVRAADVAGWFGISCSAVRHSLKELIAGGYVIRDSRDCLSLSEEGGRVKKLSFFHTPSPAFSSLLSVSFCAPWSYSVTFPSPQACTKSHSSGKAALRALRT